SRGSGAGFRTQIVKYPSDDVFKIAAPLPQVVVLEPVVGFVKFAADLLDRPLRIDGPFLNCFDDAIDEKLVLKNQQVCVHEKGGFRNSALPKLRLHALELLTALFDRGAKSCDFFGCLRLRYMKVVGDQ